MATANVRPRAILPDRKTGRWGGDVLLTSGGAVDLVRVDADLADDDATPRRDAPCGDPTHVVRSAGVILAGRLLPRGNIPEGAPTVPIRIDWQLFPILGDLVDDAPVMEGSTFLLDLAVSREGLLFAVVGRHATAWLLRATLTDAAASSFALSVALRAEPVRGDAWGGLRREAGPLLG